MKARIEASPSRSSSQPLRFGGSITVAILFRLSGLPGDHDFLAPDMHCVLIERARRGPRNNLPVHVVKTVVTRTPDLVVRLLILHRAVQVRADRGEGAPLGFAGPHQQHREATEFNDLAAVRLEIL